jgi:hypothetical protein
VPILVKGSKSCLFIHVPKAGGSSFEMVAKKLGWTELISVRGFNAEEIKFLKSSPQHFHAEILDKILNYDQLDQAIMLCREPFSRLKSEYYWQQAQGLRNPSPRAWLKDTFRIFENNPYVYDNHLRPQVDFVPRGVKVDIFRLEDGGIKQALLCLLGECNGLRQQLRRYYVDILMKHEKKSNVNKEIEQEFLSLKELIVEKYIADYEFFGYEK